MVNYTAALNSLAWSKPLVEAPENSCQVVEIGTEEFVAVVWPS